MGAGAGAASNATFSVTDRCNGTRTKVTKGRVRVFDRARKRTVTVRAGRAYLAKARIFRVRRGRG